MPYPSRRYHRSWVTQRMTNDYPEFTHARTCPTSVAHQVLNFGGSLIEDTTQKLIEERDNQFLSSADPNLMDHLYLSELPSGFFFTTTNAADGAVHYIAPTVQAKIGSSYTTIEQAEFNNIETLYYDCLPTRFEDDNKQHIWVDVLPQTEAANIWDMTPEDLVLEGHLYITIENNTIWQREFKDQLYFSKAVIKGTTRKGTELEETVPLRLNGTFQTINQWKSVSDIQILHVADDADITISCLPFAEDPVLDPMNLAVPVEGGDRIQFVKLVSESFGSTLVGESFVNEELEFVRLGADAKRQDYVLELLDQSGNNVSANGFMLKPHSQMVYVIDNQYFYVYDRRVPYPDVSSLAEESADCRMEITVPDSKWIYTKNDVATVTTRTVDLYSIPTRFRWAVTVPDGTKYRVGADGSYWPEDTVGWISNDFYSEGSWQEQMLDFTLDQRGQYVVELEVQYIDDETSEVLSRIAKIILYVPYITPETQIALPTSLRNCIDIAIDSDGVVWLYNGTSIYRAGIYHDYFAVDYQRNYVWTKEQYTSVKVTP